MSSDREQGTGNLRGIHRAIEDNQIDRVREFISAGADLEQGKHGRTPLKLAIDGGYLEIVKLLLEAGALVTYSEGYLLRSAIERGKTEILEALLAANIDVNQRWEDNETALIHAVWNDNFEAVQRLVQANADVNAMSDSRNFALLSAAENGLLEIFNYLAPLTDPELRKLAEPELPDGLRAREIRRQEAIKDFMKAAARGDLEAVIAAVERERIDVNDVDINGNTALCWAAFWGQMPVVRTLTELGANVNHRIENDGATPLIQAATMTARRDKKAPVGIRRHFDVVGFLIEAGADINAQTNDGWTALMAATEAGGIEAVSLLLQVGANANARDNHGQTALSIAKKAKRQSLAQLLLDAGAQED